MYIYGDFYKYLVYYPEKGQDGYDGVHDGGIKGIKSDTPKDIKEQYKKFRQLQKEVRARKEML